MPLSKRPKVGFQDQLSLNAGQKYCRMLQGEHSAILSTFIRLPFVIKIFILYNFESPFCTGFTVGKKVLFLFPLISHFEICYFGILFIKTSQSFFKKLKDTFELHHAENHSFRGRSLLKAL